MQIIVDTNDSDDKLKLAVEQALTELEKRTGQQFQVVVKPKGASSSSSGSSQGSTIHSGPSRPAEAPVANAGGGVAAARAKQMEEQMGKVDLGIIGNPGKNKSYY